MEVDSVRERYFAQHSVVLEIANMSRLHRHYLWS